MRRESAVDATHSKPYRCGQCNKRYTKLEHLTRHERAHSNSKPFQCRQCGKSFGRQDVLGRHMRLHTANDRSQNQSTVSENQNLRTQTTGHGQNAPPQFINTASNYSRHPDTLGQPNSIETHSFLESDNLLEWLTSDMNGSSVIPLPLVDLPGNLDVAHPFNHSFDYAIPGDLDTAASPGPGNMALNQTYKLIDDLSRRLNSDFHHSGFTSGFLDACLHEFFERVSPSFPVIHAQTFSPQRSIPPLLLNMVALGSLFVCEKGATEKGEMLWRLGHTAVATSWQALIEIRGPWDTCDGVQVVLSALLGQMYALLSSNASIRTTSSVFHGLGFYWARTSGMYSVRDVVTDTMPTLDMSESEKYTIWKSWAASEVQRRVVLAHYVLDGLISQASGSPASARHLINSIGLTCSDAAFAAENPDEWIREFTRSPPTQSPISKVFVRIFAPDYAADPLPLSRFSIHVLIEGLQSLIADVHEVRGLAFGTISKPQIIRALLGLFEGNITAPSMSSGTHHHQMLVRWHCVMIEATIPSVSVYQWLCHRYRLPQALGGIHAKGRLEHLDLNHWATQAHALRAALHAIAITRLLNNLPLSQSYTIHIPTAVFTSAVVMVTICLLNRNVLNTPEHFTWSAVWSKFAAEDSAQDKISSSLGLEELSQDLGENGQNGVVPVNLLDELNSLQVVLKTVAARWGVSAQMEDIIGNLAKLARDKVPSII